MKHVSLFCLATALSFSLFGCATDKTSSNPDDQPPVHLPEHGDQDNPIEEDKGYKLVDDTIYLDGEVLGTIEKNHLGQLSVVDEEGNTLAYIEDTTGGWMIIINHEGSGMYRDHYHLVKDDTGKWTVDWANSVVDHGWGVDPDTGKKADAARINEMKKQHILSNIKAKQIKR